MITAGQLLTVMPKADPGRWLTPMNSAMAEYSIDGNTARQSMFLAQVAEETNGLTRLDENMSYSAERLLAVWPLHFRTDNAWLYANNPERLGNFIYANRMGNGNEASGDGWLFHGRGGGMLTGKANYEESGYCLGMGDLVTYPEQVATDATIAMRTAAWFWASVGGNKFADKGAFQGLCRAWNGGLNGLEQRVAYWNTAQKALA